MTVCPSGVWAARPPDNDSATATWPGDGEDRAERDWRGRHRPEVGEELLHLVEDLVRVDGDEVVRAGQLDEPRARDALGEVAALLDPAVAVTPAVHDQRGHPHRAERVADVHQRVHGDQRTYGRRGGRRPSALAPPAGHRIVGGRAHRPHVSLPAPLDREPLDVLPALLRRVPPLVVVGAQPPRVGPVEHQRLDPFRVHSGHQDRQRPALGVSEQDGPLGPGGVHHGQHVMHPGLLVRQVVRPVRHAGAALVEANQPAQRPQPIEEDGVSWVGPVELQVRNEPGHQHDVPIAAPGDLVRDLQAIADRVVDRLISAPRPPARPREPDRRTGSRGRAGCG